MTTKQPVLNLSTKENGPLVVRIDEKEYPLRPLVDLTKPQYRRDRANMLRLGEILQKKHQTARDAQLMGNLLKRVAAFVLPAPPTVHRQLNDLQRVQIISTFTDHVPSSTK